MNEDDISKLDSGGCWAVAVGHKKSWSVYKGLGNRKQTNYRCLTLNPSPEGRVRV